MTTIDLKCPKCGRAIRLTFEPGWFSDTFIASAIVCEECDAAVLAKERAYQARVKSAVAAARRRRADPYRDD